MMCVCMDPFTHTHTQTSISNSKCSMGEGWVVVGEVWWGYSGFVRVSHNDVCMYGPIHTHTHAQTHTHKLF